jgi:hypothetical protein
MQVRDPGTFSNSTPCFHGPIHIPCLTLQAPAAPGRLSGDIKDRSDYTDWQLLERA